MNKFFELLSSQTTFNDETGEIFTKQIDALVRELENLVNVMGFDPVKTCENLTDKYTIFRLQQLAVALIQFYGHPDKHKTWVDGRNEASASLCVSIVHMAEWNNILYQIDFDKNERDMDTETNALWHTVNKINQQMHRTNLQAAMSLMIYSLSLRDDENNKIIDRLKEERGERYYKFPFI